jgi:riboflavin biosynthesis pyrimidine reductase
MQRLQPAGPEASDDQLAQWYALQPGIRTNMVMSADGGAIGGEGRSGSISGPADRRLLSVLRGVADAVMVAAGTVRAEGYDPIRTRDSLRPYRRAAGLADHPVLVIVTRTPTLDPDLPTFVDAPVRPVVVCATDNGSLAGVADVIECADDSGTVDLTAARAALRDRGLLRVQCEGGPQLNGGLLAAGLVDEYCITISPTALGGTAKRPVTGADAPTGFHLHHALVDGEFLFLRYRRAEQ